MYSETSPRHLLNLPGLRYVSYLQEKYFHFSSTFSFALMSSEMYSLVQFTCGIIVCWELCLLRHNTLPNRHTTSWLFMTNSFKKPKTSISRDFTQLPCIFCPDSLMAITSKTIYIYKTEENLKNYIHTHTHTHTHIYVYICLHMYVWLNHFAVHLKLIQLCKLTILEFFLNEERNPEGILIFCI